MMRETPIRFTCGQDSLLGIVHGAESGNTTGVLIVVGGPQYRVGSHRQFLLLARDLAAAGIPAMRFDYRGMGDSDGEFLGFENVSDDIRSAIDALLATEPGLERIVLWGLCDAASAIMFYAAHDPRVAGIVALNPWVRTETGHARAQIRHYYVRRLFERSFWRKLFKGEVNVGNSLGSLGSASRTAMSANRADDEGMPLPDRMAAGIEAFAGPVLLIISGKDLTAREFDDAARASPKWRDLLAERRVTRHNLREADHTFSRREWQSGVSDLTREWVAGL